MRKVLMIAYTFPPRGGSGVQRTLKFAKYLPQFGWQPVILTVSNPPIREVDHTLSGELPSDLAVHRAPDLDMRYVRAVTTRLFSRIAGRSKKGGSDSSTLTSSPRVTSRRAWADSLGIWLLIPDPCIRWLPGALLAGLKIIRTCDVIYSTSAPFTDHLVAWFLHMVSGKPWVADFRDPWTQYVIYQRSSRLRARIDAFLEELLLRTPDAVTVTCPETERGFHSLYPSLSRDKFVVITNGFDAEDFDQPVDSEFERFTIAYTGRFDDKKNTSRHFLRALRMLRSEHPELASQIQVVFAGSFGERSRGLLKEWDLEGMVKPLGYVLHQESVRLLLKSHALLLTLSDEPGVDLTYPGKLFEYLAAGRTILALVPEGATANLIREMDAGVIVSPRDMHTIKETILDLYTQYKHGNSLLRTYQDLQQFERRTLTNRLARCLDAVLQGQPACM
jgi:glycosyltransferase involved in cell wall biosynthesis